MAVPNWYDMIKYGHGVHWCNGSYYEIFSNRFQSCFIYIFICELLGKLLTHGSVQYITGQDSTVQDSKVQLSPFRQLSCKDKWNCANCRIKWVVPTVIMGQMDFES